MCSSFTSSKLLMNSESSINFSTSKSPPAPIVAKSHLTIEKRNDFYMIVVAKLQRSDFSYFKSGSYPVNHVETVCCRNNIPGD